MKRYGYQVARKDRVASTDEARCGKRLAPETGIDFQSEQCTHIIIVMFVSNVMPILSPSINRPQPLTIELIGVAV